MPSDETRVVSVEDVLELLPKSERRKVLRVLRDYSGSEATSRLKPIFNRHAAKLLKNGMVPDYLAYALPFFVGALAAQLLQSQFATTDFSAN